MEKRETISKFALKRPYSIAVYGYGSGVFKQNNQSDKKPLTDVIFIVDDLKKWHIQNMALNPKDYSLLGRVYLNYGSIEAIKGKNKVTYFSEIKEYSGNFKYGVIEVLDFKKGLETWDNIFMAGRFHKPVLEIKANDDVRSAIEYNRECALMISCLFCDKVSTIFDIYTQLCSLSYWGDARMGIAENPHKVENIVRGSFYELKRIYLFDKDYLCLCGDGKVLINHNRILERISYLPSDLLKYLEEINTNYCDLLEVRINIGNYILNKNREESKAQIIEGIKTNGLVRSVPYALAKVKKRFE